MSQPTIECGTQRVRLTDVAKTFVMHLQGGVALPAVRDVSFAASSGECVVLGGPSGAGKSSILKMIYGNYLADFGQIEVCDDNDQWHDIVTASPRTILWLRQHTIGYVSQFLRVIPRVGALDVVSAEAKGTQSDPEAAREKARALLARLNLPERLWNLPPSTFSGGEQQRVNIARGFAAARPVLLLDEPTASLDAANRAVVVELIEERKRQGATIIGIFHDPDVREQVASRIIDVTAFAPGRAV